MVGASEPLLLAGHSFGATVCLEMARQAEAAPVKFRRGWVRDYFFSASGFFDKCALSRVACNLPSISRSLPGGFVEGVRPPWP